MSELLYVIRLVHIVGGLGWLGEVITINFVLLPALFNARGEDRITLLTTAFPFVFRLATVLGGIAVGSGLILLGLYTYLNPLHVFGSRWGALVLTAGSMATALYMFHLFQESKAERSLAADLVFTAKHDDVAARRLLQKLAIFPRAGMIVLLMIVALMVAAAHLG